MPLAPFVVGQWVRAEKFYGRDSLIEEILDGPRDWLWVLGTRRIGKTSLLKQLEHLTANAPEPEYVPIFWDFQGATDPDELRQGFADALLDAEDRLAELGIDPDAVEDDDLFRSLGRLRRAVRSRGLKLLLLCDEVEELIRLSGTAPDLLGKLRRAMQSHDGVRSVLASTIRLWELADQRGDTSPFLHGFSPPLYIASLSDAAATELVRQSKLPGDSRPGFDDRAVESIRAHCDNHPYLIQLVAKRYAQTGDLDEALEEVASDRMVSYFFSVDFAMLSDTERTILGIISDHSSSTSNSIQDSLPVDSDRLSGLLYRLENLGYVRRNDERRYVLKNHFFRRWLRERPDSERASIAEAAATVASQGGATAGAPTLPASPDFGERYRIVRRVGQGATGVVYKAHDTQLKVDIAIKALRPEYASHPEAVERFRQEIVCSRDVVHPNIVRIYDLGQAGETRFFTMQWVEGSTLARAIAAQGRFETGRAVAVARKLASALEALHAAGVLHRDIKPRNILLDERDEPHLMDFGLVRLLGTPGLTRGGIFLGTPDYASPEQARTLPLDERSDIYSLGLVIFEMVTGRRPFRAPTGAEILRMHRDDPPPSPAAVVPAVPGELSDLVLRCLEKDPARRFAGAGELRRGLERLA